MATPSSATIYDETVKFGYGKHLQTQVISSSTALVTFASALSDDYPLYLFDLIRLLPTTDGGEICLQVSYDGTNWGGIGYWWGNQFVWPTGMSDTNSSATGEQGFLRLSSVQLLPYELSGELLFNRSSVALRGATWSTLHAQTSIGVVATYGGGKSITSTDQVLAVRFFYHVGNIASGTIRCYGLKTGI